MMVLNMDIYLANLSKRYRTANKHEKGIILNELCEMGGFHKKHAIRLLNMPKKKLKPRINLGRPNLYPEKLYWGGIGVINCDLLLLPHMVIPRICGQL